MRIGAHVDRHDVLKDAADTESQVVQIFLSAPRSWQPPKFRGDEHLVRESGLEIFVHAPYLCNPASLNAEVRRRSREAILAQSRAAAEIGARGVVVHGGHPTGSGTVDDGINGWLEVLCDLELPTRILVENTAGGNAAVARRFDNFARLLDALRGAGHDVGVCLDTCHAHAGGEHLEGVVERLVSFAGAIDLVHANDSKDEFNSGRDRHENIGSGACELDDLVAAVAAARCPVVVETPGGVAAMAADVRLLRERIRGR